MLAGPTLTLLIFTADPTPAAPVDPVAVRAELEICAERIEELKMRQESGRELDRLLRRAQELAAELEGSAIPLPPAAPSPEELREQADAARDEVDRLSAAIATLDVRIEDARRGRGEPGPVARAVLGGAPSVGDPTIHKLLAERAMLIERRARVHAQAAHLDAAARAAEKER